MSGAAFQYMYDHQGRTYLDAYNNIPHIGHCHPEISRVISRQVRTLNTNTRYLYEELPAYAEELLALFPPSLDQVFFVNSGSEANDLALRMARHYTGRKDLAVLQDGYHGHTHATLEASAYKFDGKGGSGRQDHILGLPLPRSYRGQFPDGQAYAEDAKQRIGRHAEGRGYPAALLAEPVSGCGGQVPLASGYLATLKPYLEEHGILTIMDEVQVGFGRLGKYFWGFEMHGIVPDMVVIGKPMANGHPMGAVVTTRAIADHFDNGMEFFSSFGGNPVSCAVGAAVLKVIREEGLQENARTTGAYYREQLRELQAEYPIIGDVRGSGLFIGVEFTHKDGSPGTEVAKMVKESLKSQYILVSTDGPHNNVIKSKPPLCFTKANVDQVIAAMRKALSQLEYS